MLKNALSIIVAMLLLVGTSMLVEMALRIRHMRKDGKTPKADNGKKSPSSSGMKGGKSIDDCDFNRILGYNAIPIMDYTDSSSMVEAEEAKPLSAMTEGGPIADDGAPTKTVSDEDYEERQKQKEVAKRLREEQEKQKQIEAAEKGRKEQAEKTARSEMQARENIRANGGTVGQKQDEASALGAQGMDAMMGRTPLQYQQNPDNLQEEEGLKDANPGDIKENPEEMQINEDEIDWNEIQALMPAMNETDKTPAIRDDSLEHSTPIDEEERKDIEQDNEDILRKVNMNKMMKGTEEEVARKAKEAKDILS